MTNAAGYIKLDYCSYFKEWTLYCGWNAGFFSNLSTCLWNIAYLHSRYNILPKQIDFSKSFGQYKTKDQLEKYTDIYPLLFKSTPIDITHHYDALRAHHTLYKKEDVHYLSLFALKYFTPSDSIMELQKKLCHKYNIDLNNTLVVCVRGTDKKTEIPSASLDQYYNQSEELLKKKPNFRVWIQTDQKQYQDYFLDKYPKKAFVIEEVISTQGNVAISNDPRAKNNKFQHAEYLLAAIHLSSCCDSIITYTGNIAYWQALFRGNLNNFYQDAVYFFYSDEVKPDGGFKYLPLLFLVRVQIQSYIYWLKKSRYKIALSTRILLHKAKLTVLNIIRFLSSFATKIIEKLIH